MSDYTPVIRPLAVQTVRVARRKWQQGLCLGLSAIASLYVLAWTPKAFENWAGRDSLRAAAVQAEAADYDAVRSSPEKFVGKTVRWPLMRRDGQGWFYRGDPSKPIRWSVPPPDVQTYRQAPSVVATVAAADSGGVELAFSGFQDGLFVIVKLPT